MHLEDFRGAKQSYRTAYKLCVHSDVRKSIAKSYLKGVQHYIDPTLVEVPTYT